MHSIENGIDYLGTFLLIFPCLCFVLIIYFQFQNIRPKTYRIIVLIARTSIFLPLYGVIIWSCMIEPNLFDAMQIPLAFIEGYTFYSVFGLIVANLGGPVAAVKIMEYYNKEACLSCFPRQHLAFYNRVLSAQYYFITVRPLFVIAAAVCAYKNLTILFGLFSLIALILLCNALFSLIGWYESIMHLKVGHFLKLTCMKLSVGIIVIQNLIFVILYESGALGTFKNSNGYSEEGTVTRYYCFFALCEYALFSMLVCWVYSADIEYLDFKSDDENDNDQQVLGIVGGNSIDVGLTTGRSKENKSFFEFVYDICQLSDIWTVEKYSLVVSHTKYNESGDQTVVGNPLYNGEQPYDSEESGSRSMGAL